MNLAEKMALLRLCGIKFRVAVAAKALAALLWMPLGAFAATLVASRINISKSLDITWIPGGFRAFETGDVGFILGALAISCAVQFFRVKMARLPKADSSFLWSMRQLAMIVALGCFTIIDQSIARSQIAELDPIVTAASQMSNEQLAKMAKEGEPAEGSRTKSPTLGGLQNGELKKGSKEDETAPQKRRREAQAAKAALEVRAKTPNAEPLLIRKELMAQDWWPTTADFFINILVMLLFGVLLATAGEAGEMLVNMASRGCRIAAGARMSQREIWSWRRALGKARLALIYCYQGIRNSPQRACAAIQQMYRDASAMAEAVSTKKRKLIDVGMGGDKGWCEAERALLDKEIVDNKTQAAPRKRSGRL